MPISITTISIGSSRESMPGMAGILSLAGGAGMAIFPCGGDIQMRGGRLKAWRACAPVLFSTGCIYKHPLARIEKSDDSPMTDDGFSQRIQATDAGPMNRRCVRYACPPDRTAWPLRRCPYTSPIHRPPDGQL